LRVAAPLSFGLSRFAPYSRKWYGAAFVVTNGFITPQTTSFSIIPDAR
jgi:nitrate reductase alpha subunit